MGRRHGLEAKDYDGFHNRLQTDNGGVFSTPGAVFSRDDLTVYEKFDLLRDRYLLLCQRADGRDIPADDVTLVRMSMADFSHDL